MRIPVLVNTGNIRYTKRGCTMVSSWAITGLGIIVSFIGWYLIPSAWGYGIFGFGLAHIVLGILERFREPANPK